MKIMVVKLFLLKINVCKNIIQEDEVLSHPLLVVLMKHSLHGSNENLKTIFFF